MELFGTAGVRGDVRDRVTPALALAVGAAVGADAVDADTDAEVVVGRDGRTTGPALAAAAAGGAASAGAAVRRVGRVPTPALAFAARGRHGVMVTASHNPPADNGLKCFADGREYDAGAEARVAERVAEGGRPAAWEEWGDLADRSALREYRGCVADYARGFGPMPSVTVAVDCGCGAAGRATPQVLRSLGADVSALEANVDGRFPARESKPTGASLGTLRRFVADGGAGLGLAHDGDGDRIVLVDGDGEVVHEDTVVAVLAEEYVRRSAVADPVVVTTPNASTRIDERVAAAGGRVERVRLGALHEGVAASGGDVVFAAEPWKHLHPDLGPWIDGVASAAVLTTLVADRGLDALRAPVTERPYRKESVPCPDDAKPAVMERLEAALPGRYPDAAVDTDYGVRLDWEGAWTLVRPSGTEPYVRVYAESEDADALVADVADAVREAVDAVASG